jgi:GNAT superfamily N-acetyltransferase
MGPDEERAAAFARWYDEQVCTAIEPWWFGTRYIDEDFPRESDTNFVRLETAPERAGPGGVVAAADAVLEGIEQQRIVIDTVELADHMADSLEPDGWTLHEYALLVRATDEPLPPAAIRCEEVSLTSFLRFRATFGAASASRAYLQKVERRVGSRYFLAMIEDRPASGCVLWTNEGDAQIDAVETAPALRGLGAGAAVVSQAIHAANAGWVHLYTEAATGPLPFYKSLGFEVAGSIVECTRTRPDPHP